jgi:HD-GYP domain-containing protein (c-di-GMP phosphodiesterase class II)
MDVTGQRGARDTVTGVRLAEVVAALSLATDLGMGHPLEYALCSCVLAVRLGEALGLDEEGLREVYYQALLRYIGCNAEVHVLGAFIGDELALRHDFAQIDAGQQRAVMQLMLRYMRAANAGGSPLHMAKSIAHGLLTMPGQMKPFFAGHCEVAERLAERLGFGPNIRAALGQLYERWDGKGMPNGLKGEAVLPAVRVVALAQDMITFHRLGGQDAAVATAKERSGGAYDPRMAECFCKHAAMLLADLDAEPSWDAVIALEPGERRALSGAEFDAACAAMADFGDLKSAYTLTHSSGVARLAAEAARRARLPDADVTLVRRAGLLHDIGRVGVSVSVWEKPGAFTEREWERVRLHAYHTERVLARPASLARIGGVASLHHERLDGSGYHRGIGAASLPPAARILAAADVYQAMTEARAHRPARSPEAAAEELRGEVHAGRLDAGAANCVLEAAGHRVPPRRRALPAGLSEREVEVLRLIARGNSIKDAAAALFISRKTVDNHIQNIYSKIGVSTRAGATLFAMEHDLLADAG